MSTATDIEARGHVKSDYSPKLASMARPAAFVGAAALLSIWSLIIINEGAVRFVSMYTDNVLSDKDALVLAATIAGLCEFVVGVAGLLVGVAAFIRKAHNTTVTKAVMWGQTVLGYYVFIVYVFVIPLTRAINLREPSLLGLSLGQSRVLIVFGILVTFHFSLALQAGQSAFLARLVSASTGRDVMKQLSGTRMWAFVWNANLGLAGVWTVATGVLVATNLGSGILDVPYVSPPNEGRLPGLTLFAGALMILWAVVGIVIVGKRMAIPCFYFPLTGCVYVVLVLNYTVVQAGFLDGAPAKNVAPVAGLVFMVLFMGPYFVHLASE